MRCFQGVAPAIIATCSRDGTPNVTYLTQVHYLDDKHVALSCQFFNKTRRNIAENPYASVQLYDPLTLETYQLELRFDHAETSGPLFDAMSARIQAIASHTGMAGVFKLLSADVYEVLSLEPNQGFVSSAPQPDAPAQVPPPFRTEIKALHAMSERLSRAGTLDDLLASLLAALREELGFEHSMVLLRDEEGSSLYAVSSLGYGDGGIGAEVAMGEGLIGTAAETGKTLRVSAVGEELRYARAVRHATHGSQRTKDEIPLPGLPDAQAHLAIPLVSRGHLVGVLACESHNPLAFDEWHEAFLDIIGNQAATAIENMMHEASDAPEEPRRSRTFTFYKNDDCVFVDGDYLIRNVPGRILWKILKCWSQGRRTDFTNRELRLDPSLGLPPVKDNLESRLILLRKRLAQKCQDVRIVPKGRGQFRLELDSDVELVEKESA
jgi:hypothetical protein